MSYDTKIEHSIITAPTQVGKTNAIIDVCKSCKGEMIVISCDNKTDQLNQTFLRLKEHLNVYKIGLLNNEEKQDIKQKLLNLKTVVIIILNNKTQIKQLTKFLKSLKNIKKYTCIHDESDVINKSDVLDYEQIIKESTPKSHQEWLLHFDKIQKKVSTIIHRIHVSATCESSSILFDIKAKNITVLKKPDTYRSINKYTEWFGLDNDEENHFYKEIDRINSLKNAEVILYCCERTILQQCDMAENVSKEKDCVCIAYNSSGIKYYIKGIRYFFKNSIQELLSKLKEYNKTVVIFGNNMMCRGVSFVSNCDTIPLTATVLFYDKGKTYHMTGIVQKFGRITGCSRPDIQDRKVYCMKKVFEDYQNYIYNQDLIFKYITDYPDLNMLEILDLLETKFIKRDVERKCLKSVNKAYLDNSFVHSDNSVSQVDSAVDVSENTLKETNIVKMKSFVDSWIKKNNKTQVSTLFKKMVENDFLIDHSYVKELMVEDGKIHHLTNKHNQWNLVFRKSKNTFFIKKEAVEYYKSL